MSGSSSEILDELTTLERILQQRQHPLFMSLVSLWLSVQTLPNAWTFPAEKNGVSGFAGLAPVFVIGEQPSLSSWTPANKGRRLLYDSLLACGAGQVHLTDIVKSRGKGHEWRDWPPERLQPHIDLLHRELNDLQPENLILLGNQAQRLFLAQFPKYAASAKVVPHFGFLRRVRRENEDSWREHFRNKLAAALR